ncbi:hypothetical protein J0X19_06345 [Hymenobacter sp. BT186]|uniref:Uncharacterized protein n=1 Tax=Hymenobacter telluris TaxID=2816474 RepID=A0A939EUV5_9BACT|nr:hypothetical protein [Hymenobacter telluris]MBO0357559.1 hypothetical protein [Hymenobacter telluris]MBW3373585.1 hypothetical protein [Hymenobacter norwichensis]
MSDTNPLAALRAAAEAVRQQLHATAFDAAAVQQLASFIEAQRSTLPAAEKQGVITALGCFLGECLVQTYNGTWAQGPDGTTGVGINHTSFFNPFFRVAEQFEKGNTESVVDFFTSVPIRLANPSRRQWIS